MGKNYLKNIKHFKNSPKIKNLNKDMIFAWFDYWMKEDGNNIKPEMPKVKYFTMGKNEWQEADTWPPQGLEMVPFYLHSQGNDISRLGDRELVTKRPGKDQPDTFTYDPMDPVSSYGGNVCCTGNAVQGGAYDQQEMELREDILVYTSDPLEEDMEVSGFIEATLYLSSDVKDTDLTLKILDVYPDGTAYNLDETIQRVRYREGYEKEVFMDEGLVYEVGLTPMSTSNYFEKGHRIRIEVSSSNFPRFDRSLNQEAKILTKARASSPPIISIIPENIPAISNCPLLNNAGILQVLLCLVITVFLRKLDRTRVPTSQLL